MFEIKLSQGAKPGKGGILPAIKVSTEVAKIRGIPEHVDSISPNRHIDISNVEELLDVVNHIRTITGKPVGCKFVLGRYDWLHEFCLSIHKRGVLSLLGLQLLLKLGSSGPFCRQCRRRRRRPQLLL